MELSFIHLYPLTDKYIMDFNVKMKYITVQPPLDPALFMDMKCYVCMKWVCSAHYMGNG